MDYCALVSSFDWLISCAPHRIEIVTYGKVNNEIWCGQKLLGRGVFLRDAIAEAVKHVNDDGWIDDEEDA